MKMMTTMLLQDEASNHHNEAMAPFVYPSSNLEVDDTTKLKTLSGDGEEVSVTVSPSSSEDWSEEEYPSDEEDQNIGDDDKVNGTGLVMYVTPTATKAAYWKRRLGWKPNMAKTVTKKIKQVFRAPVRNSHIRSTGSYEVHGADALIVHPKQAKKPTNDDKDHKRVLDEGLVLEYESKDFDALGSINHDLVFA